MPTVPAHGRRTQPIGRAQPTRSSTTEHHSVNDTNLTIAVPNGNYNLTFYGEPGYGVTTTGQNVFDVEVQGSVISSYNDGFFLAGRYHHER